MNKTLKMALLALLAASPMLASAQTDATAITTTVNAAFVGVAAACIGIGGFFAVYKLIKRIK